MAWARWASAVVAAGIMAVPFLFWTTNPAAFLSDTLVGAFAFGLAVGTRPEPGTSAVAAMTGPDTPPGWSYNPSAWTQRLPIIRSEEHTSELQSLMRISYAVFCLKKKKHDKHITQFST